MIINMRGKEMKGQAYDFILMFIGMFIAIILWVVMNHAYIEVGDTLYDVVDFQEHREIIRMEQSIFYYSLFFVILVTFVYLIKISLKRDVET